MGIFRNKPKAKSEASGKSKDGNLQALVINSSHICDGFIKNKSNGYFLSNEDWKIIWASLFFSGARFMSSPESIGFTHKFISESQVDPLVKSLNNIINLNPDERYFYQLTPQHQEWLDSINKQIYEISFEPVLSDTSLAQRQLIFNEVLPLGEHYIFQNLQEIKDIHKAFSEIWASSLALATEEIVLQAPIYGLEMTKSRYGAAQVYFALALFLFNQTVPE